MNTNFKIQVKKILKTLIIIGGGILLIFIFSKIWELISFIGFKLFF